MPRTVPVTTLFLDIGGVLLTNGWDHEARRRAAKEFKIFYEKRPGSAPGAYTLDHSAQVFVLDAQGRLRLIERNERIAQDLAADLRTLMQR